jgi:hypothetical protein
MVIVNKETADLIECPHCEWSHGNYDDYIEVGDMSGEFEMNCEKCKQSFKVDFYSIFWFKSTKE